MRAASSMLLVLAAAIGALWLWTRGVEQAPLATERPAAPVEQPPLAAPPSAPADTAGDRRDAAAPVAPAGAPSVPADAIWVDVIVVDRATRAPVPGADVWWKDATSDARVDALPRAQRLQYWDDAVRVAEAFGWRARADAGGRVRVHAHSAGTSVYARADNRYGEIGVAGADDASGPRELALDPDLELAVRVVDAAGRAAAGVPVGMDVPGLTMVGGNATDANGEVRFRHLQQHLARDERGAVVDATARVSVRIAGLKELCAAEVKALALTREPLVLTLPPTGALRVHVLHPGRPVEGVGVSFWIGAVDDHDARDEAWCRTRDPDGVVRFPFVPLGRTFTVGAEVGDLELHRTVIGPARDGETVAVTLEVPRDAVAVTGRILDENGRPLASHDAAQELSADLRTSRQDGYQRLATDVDGRFVLHVRAAVAPDAGAELELRELTVSLRRGPLDVVHGT